MKIAVLGPGAVGCLLGAQLSTKNDVTMIARSSEKVNHIAKSGIIAEKLGNFKVKASTACPEDAELVILATKACDIEAALSKLLVPKKAYVMPVQNGLGNIEIVERFVPKDRIIPAVVYCGVVNKGNAHIVVHGKGKVVMQAGYDDVYNAFISSGITTEQNSDIKRAIWSKLIANVSINALGAIVRATNGELWDNKGTKGIMIGLAKEANEVGKAEGVDLTADYMKMVEFMVNATYKNRNSMCQDIEAGRKTEIDVINGAVVRLGKKHGIPTPLNHAVVAMVKFLEQ